jgi:hypothetical protein
MLMVAIFYAVTLSQSYDSERSEEESHRYPVIARLTESAEAFSWMGKRLLRSACNDIRRKTLNDMEIS